MNKGELIYLRMSNGDRVFLNVNEIIAVLVNRIDRANNDDDDNIATEIPSTELVFYMTDKTHFQYTFSNGDPDGVAVVRQLKNFIIDEAFV